MIREAGEETSVSIAVVDARGWQNAFDLKTGDKTSEEGPAIAMAKSVLKDHPYPGDMSPKSNRWVSDTAIDLIDRYSPRFAFLTYAAQLYTIRYLPLTGEERRDLIHNVFFEAERFVRLSGFASIVVGTGGSTPFLGFIDVTKLDGLAVCTHWSARYAGLYEPSSEDMKTLSGNPLIQRIVTHDEITTLFDGNVKRTSKVPEYMMIARKGYAFKTATAIMKMPMRIPDLNFTVPVHAPDHELTAITDIRCALEKGLTEKKMALIVMEGVGIGDFLWPQSECANGIGWYYYEPGWSQYMAITSGRHRFLEYPTGYRSLDAGNGPEAYPFSGFFRSIPEGTIGRSFPGRSIAVGNRSMIMHMAPGCDISVECFARNLYNQGTMAVIHRSNKL